MKTCLAFIFLIFISICAHAQSIGIVDPQKIVQTSTIGKKMMTDIKTFKDTKQVEIDNLKKTDTQKALRLKEDSERDLQNRLSTSIQAIEKKALPIIQKVAASKGYLIVVQRDQVVYHDPKLDITDEVIKILNSQP
jgi:Skp family chaperone for outer membrane proteins